MLQNYLKTAFRHILKSKVNFLFKLGGLTLALSGLLVIVLYVSYHLSFDKYHEDYENIYRVNARWMENGSLASYAIVPTAVGPALKEAFPEIRSFARVGYSTYYLIKYKERSFRIHGFVNADSTVFDVLTFDFIRGDRHALDNPRSIVLTKSLALQIFGDEDPMNKTISFTDRSDQAYQVSAIIADPPAHSHLEVRALLSLHALTDGGDLPVDPWEIGIDGSGPLYVRLHEGADVQRFISKAIPLLRKKLKSGADRLERNYEIYLQPIKDIHLDPWIYTDFTKKGNITYVYVFSLLGVFLLLIAAINYVNLSIADFHQRSKEIGVRKVMGARKRQVAFQVIVETWIICIAASILSFAILYLFFPDVGQALESDLRFSMLFQPVVLSTVGLVIVFLMVISAFYPAWHLAANKPVNDMKAIGAVGRNSTGNVLLMIQFSISVICICSTFVVGKQIHFFQTKDPGYNRENTIVLYMPDRYPPEKIPVIKDELSRVPGVDAVSYSTFRIVGGYYRDWYRVEIDGQMKRMLLNEVFFDHDFFRTMGIEVLDGRSFDPNNAGDAHAAFIVNEAAVREFGWKDPVGK
ncbi:MAG: FtsX-like permease family protein, partial [Cyclobacteriaceae bacterium]